MASEESKVEADAVSFQDTLLSLVRWRLLILAFLVIGAVAAAALHFVMPVRYTASSTVVLLARPDRLVEADQPGAAVDDPAILSEIAIIKSTAVAGIVVDGQKLATDPAWNGDGVGNALLKFPWAPTAPPIAKRSPAEYRETAIRNLVRAAAARRMENSYAIDVRVSADTAAEAARYTNALVTAYLDWHATVDGDRSRLATDWLDSKLVELRKEVEQRENLVEAFRESQGLLSAEGSTMAEQQLVSAQNANAAAQAELAESNARLKQVEDLRASGGSVDSSKAALESLVIQDLRVQEAQILRRIAQLKSTYFDTHPDVQKAEAEYRDTRAGIDTELARILTSLRNEAAVAENRVSSSSAALIVAQRKLGLSNESIVRLRELDRDAAASRKAYEDYQSRYQQTADRESLPTLIARQVSPATNPARSDRPSILLMIAFGVSLGLFTGIAAIFLQNAMDDRLHGASDVSRKVRRRALVSIPHVRSSAFRSLARAERRPAGYLVSKPMSAYAETFRVLRRSILLGGAPQRNVVVAVTSSIPGEGKTTIAWSLARAAALGGQRVAVVDCDLRRRGLTECLRSKPALGLSTVVADLRSLPDVLILDSETSASIIPAVPADVQADDLLGSEKMVQLIESLRRSYDFIVLDCPPVLAVADAITAAVLADGAIVVARAEKTPARAVRSAISQLEAAGCFVAGIALNDVQPKIAGRYSFDDSLYFKHAKRGYYVG